MHEYTVAYDIYATAKRAATDNGATLVKVVHVDVGEMSMINPEQVEFLFGALCEEDLLFKGAKLTANTVPVRSECRCGYSGSEKYVCPICGNMPEIVEGREILVTNIEIEVDDE